MSNSLRASLLACTALAAFSIPVFVSAQDAASDDATQLETIVVKGKRVLKGSVGDTPLATQTTAEHIAQKDIRDLDDLGNTTEPGVSWVGASQSVNIRGLEGDRVLTTIDGIPVPYLADGIWSSYGGANTYDFSQLSTVDILRGGDSSKAGSGALGGAVLLRTLEPEDLIAEGKDWGGVAKSTYDSSDKSIGGSVAVAKKIGATSMLFQGSYTQGQEKDTGGDVGGYGSTRTKADPTDYNQYDLMLKLRHELEGGHTIGVTAEHYQKKADIDNLSNSENGSRYEVGTYNVDEDAERYRLSLDYNYDAVAADSLIDSAWAKLYLQRSERYYATDAYRLTDPVGDYERDTTNTEKSYGFTGGGNSDFSTGNLHHGVNFGFDFAFTQNHQYTHGDDSCDENYVSACSNYHINQSNAPDVDSYKLGAYVEDTVAFADTGFSLTPGLRFDWYKFAPQASAGYENADGYSGLPDGQSNWQLSPKLRAAWQVAPEVELYAQFSTGFKSPNVTQLYLGYVSTYYQSIGNPDLDPESSYGFEVGANLGDDDFGAHIAAFTTRYKDFIDTETSGSYFTGDLTYQYFNRSNVRISGLEARANKRFGKFNLHGSLAYAYGEDLDTDEVLDTVAPFKGIVGVSYDAESWGADASLVGSAAVRSDSTASTKPGGYGVVNLTGWWEPEQTKGLRIQAGVYNLFDKTYYDALEVKNVSNATELYSEAGRYFKVSLTQKF